MTALPPAGWYPDPEAGGTTWRWWDGTNWSPPAYGYGAGYGYGAVAPAVMLESYRKATSKFGNWLRWAMLGNLLSFLAISLGVALVFRGNAFDRAGNGVYGDTQFSGGFLAFQLVSLPLNLVSFAYIGSFIAWIYQAGKFAEARGWPAARGRTLGAFSLLIPVVNLWWPYEAVRDSYPPGSSPPFLVAWWVSYLVTPILAFPGILAGLFGTPVQMGIAIGIGACALAVPVWLGWKVIRDVEAMQRANSPAPA
jgi:hypothetical protein